MKAGPVIAGSIVSSLLFVFIFQPPKRRREGEQEEPMGPPPPPGWTPAPSNIPSQRQPPFQPAPSTLPIPGNMPPPPNPSPPWPEPPRPAVDGPRMVNIVQGRRYKVTADLKPAKGKGLSSAARGVMEAPRFAGRFADAERHDYFSRERPGVGDVTRVIFSVTPTVNDSFPLEYEIPVPGVASVWIVSIVEVQP